MLASTFRLLMIFVLLSPPQLQTQVPVPELGEVFKDDVIPVIRLTLPADSLDAVYNLNIFDKEHLYPCTFEFDNGQIQETVENVGLRLRGNTSLSSAKKSFKLSFNTFEPGRKFYGLEKMNLNGEHNDPSIIRSKLVWDMCRWMNVPGSRANHVALYINDEYWGLYINIEHIDEEYTRLRYGNNDGNLYKLYYGCDLHYLGEDGDAYKLAPFGNRVYELKNNTTFDDYSDLAEFVDVLNNTPINELPCHLESVFNVDQWLRYLVIHVLSGHWDDPILNKNNAYLYHNQRSGQVEYLIYDVDNAFGVDFLNTECEDRPIYDWGNPEVANPLYDRILQVPEYRDRFSLYIKEALDNFYNLSFMTSYLDDKLEMIDQYAEDDPFRQTDWGFSYQDFLDSYGFATPDTWFVSHGLKNLINIRSNSAQAQLDLVSASPGLQPPAIDYSMIQQGQISISAQIHDGNLNELFCALCYKPFDQNDYDCPQMFDDGQHADGDAGDGIYGITLNLDPGIYDFHVQAEGDLGGITFFPACGDGRLNINPLERPVVINEIMSNNESTLADEVGEFDDWVENIILENAFEQKERNQD